MTSWWHRWGKTLLVLAILCACTMVIVGFADSTRSAARDSATASRQSTATGLQVSAILATLQYNATRGDCIRDVQGDADEEFRREISALFDAGRDPVKIEAVRVRMRSQPNYADTVKRVCPPATKENP